jgi:prepilin-type N-terminal cleavage/methylation domain-containing protein/prepilin-type processing-associated H-X9-DG protein
MRKKPLNRLSWQLTTDNWQFHKNAFTLVELITSIAIIAFLITLLFPALRQARLAADSVRCASNLERIGLAIAAYTQDNDGYLPMCQPPQFPDPKDPKKKIEMTNWARWYSALVLNRYLDGKADKFNITPPATVFQCPADRTVSHYGGIDQSGIGCSYFANNRVMPFHGNIGGDGGPFRITKYKNRFARIVLAEKDATFVRFHGGLVEIWNQNAIIDGVKGRHGHAPPDAFCNVLFLDWHVEPRTVNEIIEPAIRTRKKDPNADPNNLWGFRPED